MNREIKFRAWDKGNECMRDVWSIAWDFKPTIPLQIVACSPVINNEYVLHNDQFELMQYTGLKDKNGKEIYEGDIVRFGASYIKPCAVYWNEEMTGFYPLISEHGTHLEIIGNIYEHPELIK